MNAGLTIGACKLCLETWLAVKGLRYYAAVLCPSRETGGGRSLLHGSDDAFGRRSRNGFASKADSRPSLQRLPRPLMRTFLTKLAPVIAAWVLLSFVGVMFDTARADFWTQSLMASLISSVLFAPVIIFVGRPKPERLSQTPEPFVPEPSRTLWPKEEPSSSAPSTSSDSSTSASSTSDSSKEELVESGWPYNDGDESRA